MAAVCWLVLTGGLRVSDAAASEPLECQQPVTTAAADLAAAPSRFRLGTAAAPFGWATAIADFDADGRPDFAIVDRVAAGAEQYQYDLDIELSDASAQHLTLLSRIDAVTVVVEDIDHDDDLDIVITPALTRDVLAVWLNDGIGRFCPADPRDIPSHVRPPHIIAITADASASPAQAFVPSRRMLLVAPRAALIAARALTTCGDVSGSYVPPNRVRLSASAGTRAPPSSL